MDLGTLQEPGLDSGGHRHSGLGALNDSQDDSKSVWGVCIVDVLMVYDCICLIA